MDVYAHTKITAFTANLDYLVCGLPNTDTTRHIVDSSVLKSLPILKLLAQLGANAQAGFANFGGRGAGIGGVADGPDLTQFTGKFSEITTQFAREQMPQARGNLDGFERSLGTRPSGGGGGLPGGGGGGLPGGGPGRP